ncbi:glycosyltransferase family 2 protein [Ectothiorhodospira variabilis]|uniref:glycosyltransferase family 2 protein n=1 Tax=Ectothiorhodospira variabilis TaxID=505694 RepID=UPI001EFA707E|nr:glycosyltransferase family 2 protein [Ectothiorhodospira variabilis]MCG5498947.1 glycosyltransferase family 2 protein [Ectothiorhodospira variabilis]
MQQCVSLIVPAHNEGAHISQSLRTILSEARKAQNVRYELLVVDDGSTDETATQALALAQEGEAVRVLSFTRNFGKEAAIQAGLEHAEGDAVILLDADLQHPPELIPEMVRLWCAGLPVVHAVRTRPPERRWGSDWSARLFYWLFRRMAGIDLSGQCDYKLLDREVVDAYLSWPERQRFFRGLVSWAAYPSASIPFSVPPRSSGQSRWSTLGLLRYAVTNLTSFSALPLRLVAGLGLLTLVAGSAVGLHSLFLKLSGQALDGFTTVIVLVSALGGMTLLALGIVGHYLSRIYEEIKGRPSYLIRPSRQ